MKKMYICLATLSIMLSGCSDRNTFLLQCNTKGFLTYRDMSFQECRCVADRLQDSLSVEQYHELNNNLSDGVEIALNSPADIALKDAGRQCVSQFKQ